MTKQPSNTKPPVVVSAKVTPELKGKLIQAAQEQRYTTLSDYLRSVLSAAVDCPNQCPSTQSNAKPEARP